MRYVDNDLHSVFSVDRRGFAGRQSPNIFLPFLHWIRGALTVPLVAIDVCDEVSLSQDVAMESCK